MNPEKVPVIVWLFTPMFVKRWIFGGKVVYLLDFQDEVTKSLAWEYDEETLISYVYADTKTGPILLHQDGKVTDLKLNEFYIHNWLPKDKEKLAIMALSGAKTFKFR